MSEDFSVYIHLFDAQGNAVGQWDAYPGNGLYPTRLWQTNEIVVDRYRVPVSLDARGPGVARVEVGLYRKSTLQNLVARDPQGRVITPTIARFKTTGASSVVVQNPVEFKFGDEIELRGYALTREGENLRVQLFWCALKTPREDYTVFAHLVDAQGKLVAQQDNEPQRGAYPTSFWDTGEMVGDEYVLPTPRGEEHLEVGLYRARAGTRLSASGAGDARTRAVNDYVRIENPAVVAP
jgi:hypothetical protein